MSKKVNREKSKSRKHGRRGASKATGSLLIVGAPPAEGTPAEQQAAGHEQQGELKAPKAPKAPKALKTLKIIKQVKSLEKPQKNDPSTVVGGRIDTSQLRTKARAQERKMQSQRGGSR